MLKYCFANIGKNPAAVWRSVDFGSANCSVSKVMYNVVSAKGPDLSTPPSSVSSIGSKY
jgi:hypothetical protein